MYSKIHKQRLEALRTELRDLGLDGFVVPRMDRYQGEFVSKGAERLAWLSGFTGSAGTGVILPGTAGIFTDGRYTIQLALQTDASLWQALDITKTSPGAWIAEHTEQGITIGYDPWLHTPRQLSALKEKLNEKFIKLLAVETNPVDRIWEDQPGELSAAAEIFPDQVAGCPSVEKIRNVVKTLDKQKLFAAIITMPDSLAWMLNVRGRDVESMPVVLSTGIVDAQGDVTWFVDNAKIKSAVRNHLPRNVDLAEPEELEESVADLARAAKAANLPVGLDYTRSPVWFLQKLEEAGATVVDLKDPCILPKSIKTESEQAAIRAAHIEDGVAMVKFMAWLEEAAPSGNLSELDIVAKLELFRRENENYIESSFATIAGFGPNGAIVHYRATEETSIAITPPGLLLVDSGGQYHYGTTDITRTFAIGIPTGEMKRHFTLVLKAHIAVAAAHFPQGTTGIQIDSMARQPLWAENMDYAHGTGHGVGCFLCVHEEAANLSPRGQDKLTAGMLLSNEPGYYREGHYGIRIENLVLVKEAGLAADTKQMMLEFETITMAPIDLTLVDLSLLNQNEKQWLNVYHQKVKETLSPLLDKELKDWLEARTRPVT